MIKGKNQFQFLGFIDRKLVMQILFGAVLICSLFACQSKEDAWERIAQSGVLRVGLDPTYPPFELAEGESLTGLDVDLARAIGDELGLKVEFTYFGYDGLYDALATKQVDLLISGLVLAPERTRLVAYSESYFNAGEILIVPEDNTDIGGPADLNGRLLAVELGAQGHVEATNLARRLPELKVQPYNSSEEALAAVATGQADAVLIDAISGRLYLMGNPGLKRILEPVTVEPFAMVVRIEDEMLLQKINDSLSSLQKSGQFDEIISLWLGK